MPSRSAMARIRSATASAGPCVPRGAPSVIASATRLSPAGSQRRSCGRARRRERARQADPPGSWQARRAQAGDSYLTLHRRLRLALGGCPIDGTRLRLSNVGHLLGLGLRPQRWGFRAHPHLMGVPPMSAPSITRMAQVVQGGLWGDSHGGVVHPAGRSGAWCGGPICREGVERAPRPEVAQGVDLGLVDGNDVTVMAMAQPSVALSSPAASFLACSVFKDAKAALTVRAGSRSST